MARIVRSAYRYKPPPRQKKAVALAVSAIVTTTSRTRHRGSAREGERAVKPLFTSGGQGSRLGNGMTFTLEEWPAERLRRLAELWPDPTWTIQAIAHELGVGHEAVRRRAKALRLQGRPWSAGDPWPNEWSTTE